MKSNLFTSLVAALGFCGTLGLHAQTSILTVDVTKPGHKVSPMLWGIFFEDINLSADGGLYAELVRNRNFEDSDKPDQWFTVSSGAADIQMSIDTGKPVSAKNTRSLKVSIAKPGIARAGVGNAGFYGMAVQKGETYNLSFLARGGDFDGPLNISLESLDSHSYATATVPKLTGDWKEYTVTLKADNTDPKARLVISTTKPGTFWLDMVSLFPKNTWKNHGLRPDLAEMLVGLKPAFMRFPGGCWVEGDTMKESYRWRQTIGAPSERRTQHNIWAYEATHGIGFHEYLQICEDLGAEPVFCINVGMSHKENVPMDKMGEYVQDALDAIEYANGPADSPWGSLRAKAGHPASFNMKYMEIGNENGGRPYNERYPLFVRAIKEKHPEMHLIANHWMGGYPRSPMPELVDEHYYDTPDFFINQAGKYDSYDRKGPKVFVGEYAVTRNCGLGNLRGAIGEAAFMTGMERNSDIVAMSCYAPLFCNANHKRWPVNLINYDSSRVFGLPGYYVQKLFSENRGDVVLPLDVKTPAVKPVSRGGGIGVGTWMTDAEFKDMKVTSEGRTLFAFDPAAGVDGWRRHDGSWKIQDGALRQSVIAENVFAVVGDKTWNNYTYSLKARKLGGEEGFLIPFLVRGEDSKCWWNIGGWGNTKHNIEMDGVSCGDAQGSVETGRWYDIRIEVTPEAIKCYLDNKLIHDASFAAMKSLHASAVLDQRAKEIILKVVNVSEDAQTAEVKLDGLSSPNGTATSLVLTSASSTDENTLDQPSKVVPVAGRMDIKDSMIRHGFPGNSLTVIRVKAQ